MDTGMRNLEQIQEHEYEQKGPSQLLIIVLATICGGLLVLGLGRAIGSGSDSDKLEKDIDPLAALSGLETGDPDIASKATLSKLEKEKLTFPQALAATERPEISAAVAAAGAELEAMGSIPGDTAAQPAFGAQPTFAAPVPTRAADHLFPAGMATGDDVDALAAVAGSDPLVNTAALAPSEPVEKASAGQDGKFTLQVVSYRSRVDAEAFAETLQTRGHEAFVMHADIPGRGTFFRVRIGPFKHQSEAERYRRTFEKDEAMNTFVVRKRER